MRVRTTACALSAAILLASCGAPSPQPEPEAAQAVTPDAASPSGDPPIMADGGEDVGAPPVADTPPAPAPPPVDQPNVVRGDCSLTVDGRDYIAIKGDCPIYLYPDRGGAFMINSDGLSQPTDYFAQVEPAGDGTAAAYWNDTPGARHAQTRLGDNLRRTGGCWANARVKICAIRR